MRLNRRKFLKTAASLPLVAGLGRWTALGAPFTAEWGGLFPAEQAGRFPHPDVIRYDANCFTIRGRDAFLFSASFHYCRCPEPLWADRLLKLQRAGFNTIETYVFWNYHEREKGRADLGEFERFVEMVGKMGFWMIVRPGPYVCAEWDAGGFPHWVIAEGFPLRSDDPASLATSRHWYDLVVPVIRRHQITAGGPVILMQLENEYDYWPLDDAAKTEYVTALAEMAWKGGIEIPLITCWTKPVRERGNPAMAKIADFCNFYPRWKILQEVPPALAKLRQQAPDSPLGVTELQGGWFSEIGGKLSVDQEGIGPPQISMLSKTVIEQGVTFFNYYMGFGGTNFDWAAKELTTTYDYDAPLREPGGLAEKFYVARGIGESLRLLGPALARAVPPATGPESNNPAVSASLRLRSENERSCGALFLRENANADQSFRLRLGDPANLARGLEIPRRGELLLGAREMKLCPIGLAITGGELRYSTAEVLAHGDAGRAWLILYEDPGRLVEFSVAAERLPRAFGEASYRVWDPATHAAIFGMRSGEGAGMLLLDERLQVIVLPRETALRTWVAEFPRNVVVGKTQVTTPVAIPFFSDSSGAALLLDSGSQASGIHVDLAFTPGEHVLTALLPRKPDQCQVNGEPAEVTYDPHWQTARITVPAPELLAKPIQIRTVDAWVERFDPGLGEWLEARLRPLGELGPIPYGYVKYRREFISNGEGTLEISAFCDDARKVFLNGKLVPTASAGATPISIPLKGLAKTGLNRLEISYALFGSPNFGPKIGELKGIESAMLKADGRVFPLDGPWQIQRVPAAMHGREIDPQFTASAWKQESLVDGATAGEAVPAFTWCRAMFSLSKPAEEWQIPWRATLRAACDALLYLNGKFVGLYSTAGPQSDFYLPESHLKFGSDTPNVLSVMLAHVEDVRAIQGLRVSPYPDFSLWRGRIEFGWGKGSG